MRNEKRIREIFSKDFVKIILNTLGEKTKKRKESYTPSAKKMDGSIKVFSFNQSKKNNKIRKKKRKIKDQK